MNNNCSSNRVLSTLTEADYQLIAPDLEQVDLPQRRQLVRRHQHIEYVYFLDSGLASIVTDGADHPIEVGVVGREGFSSPEVLLGNEHSPYDVFIQIAGTGRRIRASTLRRCDEQSLTLHRTLMRSIDAMMVQLGQTVHANGRSSIEIRLARWLLMAHDRIDGDDVLLTHDFLGLMLGTPRPGVTTAVGQLARENLIMQARGSIKILDRRALEEKTKGVYVSPTAEELV